MRGKVTGAHSRHKMKTPETGVSGIFGCPCSSSDHDHPVQLCDEASGCPESCIFRLPAVRLRVAPSIRSSGYADERFSEFPRIAHPSAVPKVNLRVAPNPASTTGSTMNSRLSSNFASSACAADESSRPSESCTFLPYSGCILNLNPAFHPSLSQTYESPDSIALCIVLQGEKLRYQLAAGLPTVWRLGRIDLWKQVQI